MKKTLIIAEKSSLAENIAKGLSIPYRHGRYENDRYVILPCRGHLYTNCDTPEYPQYKDIKGWADYSLPIVPNPFRMKKVKGTENYIKNIKTALDDKNITDIIHWCDPDREGQLIADEVLIELKNNKKVMRAWHDDESEESIQKAFKNLKPNEEYKNIYEEARARSEIDWLIGINATILASVKAGITVHLGRVQTPIIQYIYDRDMEIENFVPEPYWVAKNEKNVPLELPTKFNSEAECLEMCNKLNNEKAVVEDVTKKESVVKPPLMFSLPSLQKFMNTRLSWSPDKTFNVTQSVYDKAFISYVRADSDYLATKERPLVEKTVEMLNDPRIKFNPDADTFNDKKINVHTAHHLTTTFPKAGDLTKDEEIIYNTIVNRLKCQFSIEDRVVSTRTMKISVGDTKFKLSGKTVVTEGWGQFEPVSLSDNLPDLKKGDSFDVEFKVEKRMTTPPPKITVNALINWCLAPFKDWGTDDTEFEITDEELNQMKKGVTIGTTATRDAIIQKIIKAGYISLKGKTYSVTDAGKRVIEIKNKLNVKVNAEDTIQAEQWLTKIGNGELSRQEVKQLVVKRLEDMISLGNTADIEKVEGGRNAKNIVAGCKCPLCGKAVIEFPNSFSCVDNYPSKKCDFSVWKEPKYNNGYKLTKTDIKALLSGKTIVMPALSKEGKVFWANYSLYQNGKWWNFKRESYAEPPKKKTAAKKTASKK